MTRYQILNAPSKWTLSVAFFGKIKDERVPLTFEIVGQLCPQGTFIEIVINSLQWEDGSSESWNFEGYALTGMGGGRLKIQSKVKGWYRTTNRKGWIDLDMPTQRQPDQHFVKLVNEIKRRMPQHTI